MLIRLSLAAALVLACLSPALAHDPHGNPNWIANGGYISPIDGQHCCGKFDCFQLNAADITEAKNGSYYIKSLTEIVPRQEVQTSRDGNYWRCKKPDGARRCFFAPPGSI